MDDKLSTLFAAMKLDEHPLVNQFLFVEETGNADGSFILSSIMKDQIKKNVNVILILCHNSLGHYHCISQKLDYNLISLKDSGQVCVFDVLDKVTNEDFLNSKEPLKNLYLEIRKQLDVWGSEKSACVVVENIGNLALVGVKEVFTFINYIRALAVERPNSNAVCSIHNFSDSFNVNQLTTSIKHAADVTVILKDLETGRASDVTGHLTIKRRENNYRSCRSEYQYQLKDRSFTVFTPGTISFL